MTNPTYDERWTIPVSAAEHDQSTLCFKLQAAYCCSKLVMLKSHIIFTHKETF